MDTKTLTILNRVIESKKISFIEFYLLDASTNEKRWRNIVGFFANYFLIVGLVLLLKNFHFGFIKGLLVMVIIHFTVKSTFFIYSSVKLYRTLKPNGITCSEVEYISKIFSKLSLTHMSSSLLQLSSFLYSAKTCKEVFEPIIVDWQEEFFEALFKKEIWKARWINVRYTYAFLAAMWQKSPIGDLIEFISKFAK